MNHAVLKITLFLCAGALYSKAHCENISDVNGIGKQMPITMAAFTMCAIGLVGLPPFNGFISKWFLGQGALEADLWIYMGLLLLSGLLNAAYFFPIIKRAYFMKSDKYVKFAEASPFMVIPIVVTAALALYLGLFPNGIFHLYDLARDTVINIMIGVGG
jgi:multicomponent Na+:H+ antiporter subunit D